MRIAITISMAVIAISAHGQTNIIGAFGWTLGKRIPDSVPLQRRDNGEFFYMSSISNMPPFSIFTLIATTNRILRSIVAESLALESDDFKAYTNQFISTLKAKYGMAKATEYWPGFNSYVFGTGTNTVRLSTDYKGKSLDISYVNELLASQSVNAREAEKNKAAKAAASKL